MFIKNQNGMKRLCMLTALTSLALTAGLQTVRADDDWWNAEWLLRKEITVDPSAAGASGSAGEARVLVRLSSSNTAFEGKEGEPKLKEDGTDIRFIASDGKTELPFYVEKFDLTMGEAHIWVKPGEIKSGAKTSFWMYYGNAGQKAVKADDSKGTFDADTVLSWSFSDKGTAPGDGTSNGNNGDAPATPVEGLSGGAVSLGLQSTIAIEGKPSLQWTAGGSMTWSAWIRAGAAPSTGSLFTRQDGGNGLTIGTENGALIATVRNGGTAVKTTPGQALPGNRWTHVVVTAGGGEVAIYADGDLYSKAAATLPALNGPIFIGAAAPATAVLCDIDEMEIAKTRRTEAWIKFAAASQGSDKGSKVVLIGPDKQGDVGWFAPGSTTSILLSSLTLDGWIVIGILAIMACVSWYVMITKVKYINGITKGNHAFMNVWKHVSQDLTILDGLDSDKLKTLGGKISPEGQKAMRKSSVYRIYHNGSEEIRHRLAADAKGAVERGLSARSIEAIKASMDGVQVREGQKLNKLIVLLTICISGGPFLGLLGTVIGVMITFAAIAAAGDVNVNSIAPGIAAALVATVAGLAVAIPALFGYNYILSRVKDANTDMHVFIDEFVTRMAEFYPDRRA